MFFVMHEAPLASIDVEWGGGLLQTGQLAAVTSIDRCEPAAFRRLFAPRPSLVLHGRGGGIGENWEFGVCFVGYKKTEELSPRLPVTTGRKAGSGASARRGYSTKPLSN
jgi:hypothetical protein